MYTLYLCLGGIFVAFFGQAVMPGLSLNSNVDSEMTQKHLINTLYDDDIASVFKADAAVIFNIQPYKIFQVSHISLSDF